MESLGTKVVLIMYLTGNRGKKEKKKEEKVKGRCEVDKTMRINLSRPIKIFGHGSLLLPANPIFLAQNITTPANKKNFKKNIVSFPSSGVSGG